MKLLNLLSLKLQPVNFQISAQMEIIRKQSFNTDCRPISHPNSAAAYFTHGNCLSLLGSPKKSLQQRKSKFTNFLRLLTRQMSDGGSTSVSAETSPVTIASNSTETGSPIKVFNPKILVRENKALQPHPAKQQQTKNVKSATSLD